MWGSGGTLIWFWATVHDFGPLADGYGPLMSHVGGLHGIGATPRLQTNFWA